MAKKRKIKKFYTIAVTSDYSCDKTKYYRSRFNVFKLTVSLALTVVLLGVGLTVFEFYELDSMESKIRVFKGIIAEQETTIERLGREKAELSTENEVLNGTVARALIEEEKNAEEDRLRHLPTGFPLTGSAHIVEPEDFFKEELDEVSAYYEKILASKKKEEEKDVEKEPYVFFAMSEISDVVAVADGTVISVSDDSTYGKCIKIDHGNGYISIYKNSGDPKVSEGDSVIRGAIIFVGGETNNFLEYQLTLDGVYVDPMESMSING
jgi:septal ring factor EnvC (AmiA/AmiB activator)